MTQQRQYVPGLPLRVGCVQVHRDRECVQYALVNTLSMSLNSRYESYFSLLFAGKVKLMTFKILHPNDQTVMYGPNEL
jgi:hypothetical protein